MKRRNTPNTELGTIHIVSGSSKGINDKTRNSSSFNEPASLCLIPDGRNILAVLDYQNNSLRFILPRNSNKHQQEVVSLSKASLLAPRGLCATEKCILICDSGHHKIKLVCLPDKLNSSSYSKCIVTHLAGTGRRGHRDGSLSECCFNSPSGICIAKDGTIFIADTGNNCIRAIISKDNQDPIVSTVAGPTSSSSSNKISISGYSNGKGIQSLFNSPKDVCIGNNGEVFIADTLNNCIRALLPPVLSNKLNCWNYSSNEWKVITIAGNTKIGHRDGSASQSLFSHPCSICLCKDKTLIIADTGNSCIRQIIGWNIKNKLNKNKLIWVRTILIHQLASSKQFTNGFEPEFNKPMGLCILNSSSLLNQEQEQEKEENIIKIGIADTGNNLIRILTIEPFDNQLEEQEEQIKYKDDKNIVQENHPFYRRHCCRQDCIAKLTEKNQKLKVENKQLRQLLLNATERIQQLVNLHSRKDDNI